MSNNHGQKLAGKIAVITGGSSGIGLATAKRFVEEGAHVVIAGRREKELKEAAAFVERNVTTVAGDVSCLEGFREDDGPYRRTGQASGRPVRLADSDGSQRQARGNRSCRGIPRLR